MGMQLPELCGHRAREWPVGGPRAQEGPVGGLRAQE